MMLAPFGDPDWEIYSLCVNHLGRDFTAAEYTYQRAIPFLIERAVAKPRHPPSQVDEPALVAQCRVDIQAVAVAGIYQQAAAVVAHRAGMHGFLGLGCVVKPNPLSDILR